MSATEQSKVLLTGATGSLGRAIALRLASPEYHLVLSARGPEALDQLAEQVCAAGGTADTHVADLTDPSALDRLCDAVAGSDPPVNVLINNAGRFSFEPFVSSSPDDWEQEFQVNLVAPMRLAQSVGKRLRRLRRPGCIVNMCSVAALVGVPGASVYCGTKGGLLAWGRAVAVEWAAAGIRVLNICPGHVQDGFGDQGPARRTEAAWAALRQAHPLGLGAPEDVAELVSALLGPAGRWITGSPIVIDGGYTCL